jgi:hypothetical protein
VAKLVPADRPRRNGVPDLAGFRRTMPAFDPPLSHDCPGGPRGSLLKALSRGDAARRVQHAIVGRLEEGAYRRVELTRDVHRRAEHFLLTPTGTSLRAADALHLALATSGQAASMASFDVRLGAAARTIGLAPYPA